MHSCHVRAIWITVYKPDLSGFSDVGVSFALFLVSQAICWKCFHTSWKSISADIRSFMAYSEQLKGMTIVRIWTSLHKVKQDNSTLIHLSSAKWSTCRWFCERGRPEEQAPRTTVFFFQITSKRLSSTSENETLQCHASTLSEYYKNVNLTKFLQRRLSCWRILRFICDALFASCSLQASWLVD